MTIWRTLLRAKRLTVYGSASKPLLLPAVTTTAAVDAKASYDDCLSLHLNADALYFEECTKYALTDTVNQSFGPV